VSDEVLFTRLQAGEQEALGSLFERYARVVRSVAARILKDATEAEDLVQTYSSSSDGSAPSLIALKAPPAHGLSRWLTTEPLSGAAT